ncbi:MAG: phospholipase D family protein [Deltaproteobacteria bacterium]|nr:phospholipase D family protein [Deltaproteobacteria bacterium]
MSLLLLLSCLALSCGQQKDALFLPESAVKAEVYFSPRGGAEAAIVRAVARAQDEIRVLAYSYTSEPINNALVAAHKRGVKVMVVLDRSQLTARGGKLSSLQAEGVPVYIDAKHAIAHNKVMILDKSRVITGSFNFTASAEERNAENLLILDDPSLSEKYLQDFERHLGHAVPAAFESRE